MPFSLPVSVTQENVVQLEKDGLLKILIDKNKKLKMLDLQMKKMKLDQDAAKNASQDPTVETAHGQVLSRNDLLERLIGDRSKD